MAVGRWRGTRGAARREPLPNWDQYAYRWTAVHGGIDPRRARLSVERWLRGGYRVAKVFAYLGARPGMVTGLGLAACVVVPWLARRGGWWALIAAGLVLVAAGADTVDGALAVLTGRTTRLGYVYDAVADRLAEVCWLVALWQLGMRAWVGVVACGVTWLHEYTRSRANAAGMTEIGSWTIGERPTRVALAVVGLALAGLVRPVDPVLPAGVATFAAAAWAVLAVLGFMHLFAVVHRGLAGRPWPTRSPNARVRANQPAPSRNAVRPPAVGARAAVPSSSAVYISTTDNRTADSFAQDALAGQSIDEPDQPIGGSGES